MREKKKKDAADAKAIWTRPTAAASLPVEDANVEFKTAIALVDLRSPATHNRWG